MESQVDLIGGEGELGKLPSGAHNLQAEAGARGTWARSPIRCSRRAPDRHPDTALDPEEDTLTL